MSRSVDLFIIKPPERDHFSKSKDHAGFGESALLFAVAPAHPSHRQIPPLMDGVA
jgi:hypothetical protein